MKFFPFFIIFLALSCAQPHYVDEKKIVNQVQVKTCDLYFKQSDLCLFSKWEVFPNESQFGQMKLSFTEKMMTEFLSPQNITLRSSFGCQVWGMALPLFV